MPCPPLALCLKVLDETTPMGDSLEQGAHPIQIHEVGDQFVGLSSGNEVMQP